MQDEGLDTTTVKSRIENAKWELVSKWMNIEGSVKSWQEFGNKLKNPYTISM
jgi:hypothetical protein